MSDVEYIKTTPLYKKMTIEREAEAAIFGVLKAAFGPDFERGSGGCGRKCYACGKVEPELKMLVNVGIDKRICLACAEELVLWKEGHVVSPVRTSSGTG
jgi:hypothetical protein